MSSSDNFGFVIYLMFHILVLTGYLRSILNTNGKNIDDLDSQSQMNYLTAIFITIISIVIITFRSMGSLLDELSNWWVGILVVLISATIYLGFRNRWKAIQVDPSKMESHNIILKFFSMDWSPSILNVIINWINAVVTGFSQLMEGDGGILWSIVFMALLFTVMKAGG